MAVTSFSSPLLLNLFCLLIYNCNTWIYPRKSRLYKIQCNNHIYILYIYIFNRHKIPDFLQLLSINVKKTSYSKSLLKGLNTGLLLQELELLMKDKKLFLNEEITLKDIAETLHISQHQLSQLINEKFNVNFNTFINSYRIEFAKKPSYRKTSPNCVYNSL